MTILYMFPRYWLYTKCEHIVYSKIYFVNTVSDFLSQTAKSKENEKIMDWCAEIIKHFWYCAEIASKDKMTQEEALKAIFF